MKTESKEKVLKKIKESLKQALRDLNVFLRIFPQIDLDKLNFITLSILPATASKELEICPECSSMIVFREDLTQDCKKFESLAKMLNSDMTQTFDSSNANVTALAQKLQVKPQRSNAPTNESLQLLKSISAFLVGIDSLYFPKRYGKNKGELV